MRFFVFPFFAASMISASALAQPRIIITEIMYNPHSDEKNGETEWVEIANVGNETIEIKDWRLDDEDKKKWGKFSCTLQPGGVAVLINSGAVKEDQFRAAWDAAGGDSHNRLDYQVIPVKWSGLGNNPSANDEVLQLRNEKDEVVCEVKQEGQWPSCKRPDGPSIWLSDLKAANISNGTLWHRSEEGKDGARANKKTDIFNGHDIGSPGYVPGLSAAPPPMPASADNHKPAANEEPKSSNTIDY
jgi:hypothetical protein